ncbi:UvrB/UvrC motif-containing protein [Candidatus Nomurabacteria bacterium]|nr:MAG: UvrB/UvrC motif-containing protein [Candidatus Nomurabacteria bacterium]
MGIYGEIKARPEKYTVNTMDVGDIAYLDPSEIIITRKAIIVDLLSYVLFPEDVTKKEITTLIQIKRIGSGITEKDFMLYFPKKLNFVFIIRGMGVYFESLDEKMFNVIFYTFHLDLSYWPRDEEEKIAPSIKEVDLKQALNHAVETENYEEAIRLREEIRKKKTQNKNPKS